MSQLPARQFVNGRQEIQKLSVFVEKQFNSIKQKFLTKQKKLRSWSHEEIDLLQKLYSKHGPVWSFLKQKFTHKTARDLKNKVNNAIRKLSSCLNLWESRKKAASQLHAILHLCFQVEKHVQEINLTPNSHSKFSVLKSNILRLCFQDNISKDQAQELSGIIRLLNRRIKVFGIFKVKIMKNWKITRKGFSNILSFDKPFLEDQFDLKKGKIQLIEERENELIQSSKQVPPQYQLSQLSDLIGNQFDEKKRLTIFSSRDCLEREYKQITGSNIMPVSECCSLWNRAIEGDDHFFGRFVAEEE